MAGVAATRSESVTGPGDGPRFWTPFGFLAAFRRDPLGFLMECTRTYGETVRISFPPYKTYLFTHPREVRYILHENHRNYWKGFLFQKLKRIAGEGLVFSDGDLWRRQRQLIQPAFQRQKIAAMNDMMVEAVQRQIDRLEAHRRAQRSVDIASEMSQLTLEIVAGAMFGTDLGEDEEEFRHTVSEGMVYANHLMNHFITPPIVIPTPANRRGGKAIAKLDRIVTRIIDNRRRSGEERNDLLAMLLAARDAETNAAMDDRQLRDEMVTFLVAGHETTAVALSWTWYLLSQNPDAERRLHAEVDEVLGDRLPTVDDLKDLPYTRMVLEESMRLYPPVWATSREPYEDDEVGGVRLPAGTTVTLSQYVTHRDPAFWPEPERFDPERFNPERSAERPEYAYFPFGGGPRRCVGQQFAMMEGQIALAMISRRLRLRLVPGHPVEPDPILTLRPRHGVAVTLQSRR